MYTHQRFICQLLKEKGIEPIIAHYEPYSLDPQLSVRLHQLFRKKTSIKMLSEQEDKAFAIGSYLPELELTYHWLTKPWKKLIEQCDYHLAVSGNVLPALPFYLAKIPYLTFNSTTYWEDRKNRIQTYSPQRKIFDNLFIKPACQQAEKKIIQHGHIMMLSEYAKKSFIPLGLPNDGTSEVLPIGIDTNVFYPDPAEVVPWHIGFVGRLSDPRKNIRLILEATTQLKSSCPKLRVSLASGQLAQADKHYINENNLNNIVTVYPFLSEKELAALYRSIDIFVIPSFQEGFCISGLEALASGCPIISTQCGGPEEYVLDSLTGYQIPSNHKILAEKIFAICDKRRIRIELSNNAVKLSKQKYATAIIRSIFWNRVEKLTKN